MELPALHRSVPTAGIPLDRLANNPHVTEREKVGEVCRQFEAVLLRQILGDAQKKIFTSPMNPESVAGGVYQDMITNQLADSISRSGGIGLARSLEKELQHEFKTIRPATDGDPKV